MGRFRAVASWHETAEFESESLDAADAWAHAILAHQPEASVYVISDDFSGSWFIPQAPRRALAGKREHEAEHRR